MDKPNIIKGEWEIVETKNDDILIVADNLIVCRINELAELTDPNAKAIKAVPKMIEALIEQEDIMQSLRNGYDVDNERLQKAWKQVYFALRESGAE